MKRFIPLSLVLLSATAALAQQQQPAIPQQNLKIIAFTRPTKTTPKFDASGNLNWTPIGGTVKVVYGEGNNPQSNQPITLPADGSGVTIPLNYGQDEGVYTIDATDTDGNHLLYCNDGQAYGVEEFMLVNGLSTATLQIIRTADGSFFPYAQTIDAPKPGALMTSGGCDAFGHPDHTEFVHPITIKARAHAATIAAPKQ